jgi:transposase
MLADFYGKVLVEPTRVVHTRPALETTICHIRQTIERYHLKDLVVAIERTGNYHLTVKRCFDRADFDTRIVHPFATKHYRAPSDDGIKTDDSDLDAIFRATLAGYGLVEQELAEPYISLRLLARHRRDLVRKRSIVCCQIREHLELVLPGYASLFDDLWRSNIALCLAQWVGSPQRFQELSVEGLCRLLREHKQRFIQPVIERVVAWAHSAATPHPESSLHQRIWLELEEDRKHKCQQISEIERDLCALLVRTPYVLLLSHPGVNVVSAAEFAGEMGPIEHYPHAKSITGRAGIYPSRHQSDKVAYLDGPLVRQANRNLRAVILWIADNLIKCNVHFRGLAGLWKQQGKDARDSRVKVACRFCRITYQLVGGRCIFAHPSQRQSDYILQKLNRFHLDYHLPITTTLTNLQNAVAQLPKSAYAKEASSLKAELHKAHKAKRREIKEIGEIIPLLLARLGVSELKSEREDLQDPS